MIQSAEALAVGQREGSSRARPQGPQGTTPGAGLSLARGLAAGLQVRCEGWSAGLSGDERCGGAARLSYGKGGVCGEGVGARPPGGAALAWNCTAHRKVTVLEGRGARCPPRGLWRPGRGRPACLPRCWPPGSRWNSFRPQAAPCDPRRPIRPCPRCREPDRAALREAWSHGWHAIPGSLRGSGIWPAWVMPLLCFGTESCLCRPDGAGARFRPGCEAPFPRRRRIGLKPCMHLRRRAMAAQWAPVPRGLPQGRRPSRRP